MILKVIIYASILTFIVEAIEISFRYIRTENKAKKEHQKLCSVLESDYGIHIWLNIKKKDMDYADENYNTSHKVLFKNAVKIEKTLLKALSKYSEQALEKLPKDYVLVHKIYDRKKQTVIYAEAVHDENLIVINSTVNYTSNEYLEETIHHELFHILSWDWEDEYKEFSAIDNSLINEDYKNEVDEEAADNWAYGFFHRSNAKSNYLHNKYCYWLRAS